MDLRKIKKLIELVEESGIAELEVKSGEEAVRITMATPNQGPNQVPAQLVMNPAASGTSVLAAEPTSAATGGGAVPTDAALEPAAPPVGGKPLKAPLSGTFYTAPSPDAGAFVQVGDTVSAGDVLCIVESMKMMNRIEADRPGTITAVLVPNGEPVEAGQPLFLID